MKSGVLEEEGGTTYGFLGTGEETYQLLIKVAIDDPLSSPLGLHRLDEISFGNVGQAALSGAYLANDDVFRARSGEQGLVLFTDARPALTAGAVFGLVLQNAIGTNTSSFPLGTFYIE